MHFLFVGGRGVTYHMDFSQVVLWVLEIYTALIYFSQERVDKEHLNDYKAKDEEVNWKVFLYLTTNKHILVINRQTYNMIR